MSERWWILPYLKYALQWFQWALEEQWERKLPYNVDTTVQRAVAYSDAESTGHMAVVVIFQDSIWYQAGLIQKEIRARLQPRKTQIVAYELIAAVMTVLLVSRILPSGVVLRQFVDNLPSKPCVVQAHTKQWELNELTGLLWFQCGKLLQSYWVSYARSNDNLAHAPSRGRYHILKQFGAERIDLIFPSSSS